jgi:hypothetical protein
VFAPRTLQTNSPSHAVSIAANPRKDPIGAVRQ